RYRQLRPGEAVRGVENRTGEARAGLHAHEDGERGQRVGDDDLAQRGSTEVVGGDVVDDVVAWARRGGRVVQFNQALGVLTGDGVEAQAQLAADYIDGICDGESSGAKGVVAER